VTAILQADASQTFNGELKELLPQVSATTRTLQARFEVDNRAGKLMPGMLLRLQVAGPSATRLVVPAEAVIRTGTRAVAIVRKGEGSFEPREVQLGADLGVQLEVAQGLSEGDQVVVSGQFLVDSEARLRSVLDSMATASPSAPSAAGKPTGVHVAEGVVESVDAGSITISHGPVASLKWPQMTMGFGRPDTKAFADLKPGDKVRFEFKEGGPLGWELVSVAKTGGAK
jgi:Cu(I)/Ag(I) efflux system membrane fusion protein